MSFLLRNIDFPPIYMERGLFRPLFFFEKERRLSVFSTLFPKIPVNNF